MDSVASFRLCRTWRGLLVALLVVEGLVPIAKGQGRASVTGTVLAERTGRAVIGAQVLLRTLGPSGGVEQTATDAEGNFQFDRVRPGRYAVEVQLLGYKRVQVPLRLEVGESRALDVELEREPASLETVVLSASRQRERILEAPVSVSLLEPERLRREAAPSSVEALRSVPGVDVAQTGVDRHEVALRGFNGVFASAPFVLADHREAGAPLLGLNLYSLMPTTALDLDRVEVVRGPASALYGSGAGDGVVHFFSTNPVRAPGTSVSVAGGSRRYLEGRVRQAGVLGRTVGYKMTAQFGRAHEWELDPENPHDAAELSRYHQYGPDEPIPTDRRVVDRQLRRETLYRKYQASGLLRYRLDRENRVLLRGGYGSLKSPLQTSLGTVQADGFEYSYGQLRLEAASVSAQVTLNHNRAEEDLYLYRTGAPLIDEGRQWDGQMAYRFDLQSLGSDVTLGAEATHTWGRVVSERSGGDDEVDELGAYIHTTTPLAPDLSLTLAARADYSSVTDDVHLSPRAAFVYTPSAHHSIRASYNRSVSAPVGALLVGTQVATGLPPELQTITQTLEVGYKGTLTDRLWVDLDGYYEEKNNVIATQQVDPIAYRGVGPIEYWGVDASVEVHPTPSLATFANVSYVSEEDFTDPDPEVALNAPSFKIRGGVDYGLPAGFSVGATAHYVDEFPVRAGPYVGTVEAYSLLDVRVQTTVPSVPGLSVNLTAKNVLGNEHREFVGAPALGRMVIARFTYEFP